ncbi:unnamed protein product [Cylicocyclus nassatus]|uniref:Uncharacterized protein n=1 Tax=Cylicocyclus nassatus TaxID=53992 RepID=A0AA36MH91_CYLNA|nr:unnamed protein product [Cylicocyclus nassatus]
MGGLTPFSRSQYETISRSPIDDSLLLNRLGQRRSYTEQLHRFNSDHSESIYDNWDTTRDYYKSEPKTIKLERRNSAMENSSSESNKRFNSNKILLELRPDYKNGSRMDRASVGNCGTNGRSSYQPRKKGIPPLLHSYSDEGNGCLSDYENSSRQNINGFVRARPNPMDKQTQTHGHSHVPSKTMLKFLDRSSRNSSSEVPPKENSQEEQIQNERPAYARRFMLNHDSSAPLLCRPSYDEGLTPVFPADDKLKEIPRFVLPPLPLGLRPPSPEPRNLLLNAPKKRRLASPSRSLSAFDFSSLDRLLEPYQPKSRTQKHPVCRVLKYGE